MGQQAGLPHGQIILNAPVSSAKVRLHQPAALLLVMQN